MGLVDPAAGQAARIATAMLETENLAAGTGKLACDPGHDLVQFVSFTAVGMRQIEHRAARHDKRPASNQRPGGRKGNEPIGA